MTTLSVPITSDLQEFIAKMIKNGRASNKADVVRKALIKMAEDEAVEAVLRAEREYSEGKGMRGDLRLLMKKFK